MKRASVLGRAPSASLCGAFAAPLPCGRLAPTIRTIPLLVLILLMVSSGASAALPEEIATRGTPPGHRYVFVAGQAVIH